MHEEWQRRLGALLDGTAEACDDPLQAGAQITVTGPHGTSAPQALARHHRVEPGEPPTLWIRPIAGRLSDGDYDLSIARRRGLCFTAARVLPDGGVEVDLAEPGHRALITRAGPEALRDLREWDNYTLTRISADDEAALDALESD